MLDWLKSLFGSTEEAWEDAVRRFVNSAQELEAAEQRHLALRPLAIETGDEAEWDSLQDRILYTRQAVVDLTDTLRAGSQWFRQTFGLSALRAIPLVPLAVITGSISAVVAVIYAVNSFNDNVRAKWNYINKHPELTPQQAAQILRILESSPTGTGIGGAVQGTVSTLIIGGVVLLALPSILKAVREK